jgi:DNA helicase-2/ATP-dependent DNA helicase PcrA
MPKNKKESPVSSPDTSVQDSSLISQLPNPADLPANTLLPVPEHLLTALNDAQRKAVTTLSGPLLVVAGPGSGKTRVLTHRIAAIVETRTALPRQILAVTFTNKAANEMRTRLTSLIGEESLSGMWVSTFHSACLRLLRANPAGSKLPVGFTVLDSDDAKKVLRDTLISLRREAEPSDVKQAFSSISWMKNTLTEPEDEEIALIAAAYQERLRKINAIDFDDILLSTKQMLEDHVIRDRYRQKFQHVLVDEYQDTNMVQYAILQSLAGGNVCCVGDVDQSIYSWRGSSPQLLDRFTNDFPGGSVVILNENYRSTPEILEVCQAVIQPNPAAHRAVLSTSNPSGAPVRVGGFSDDREEVSFVVRDIADRSVQSCAVLMRTNAQTRPFEEQLTRRAIAYQVVGALRFYERAEVKDALAYLRLVTNPRDVVSFTRAASTPRRGLGQVTVDGFIETALNTGVPVITHIREQLESGKLASRTATGVRQLLEQLDAISIAASVGPAEGLQVVLKNAGLRAFYEADKREGPDRVANLAELVSAARGFVDSPASLRVDGSPVASLTGFERTVAFLENTALVATPTGEEGAARVALMTVHAAKGREFDDVYVVGLEETLFPHFLPHELPDIEEERRLLFVACSRARRHLTLTYAGARLVFGRRVENARSRFLSDLPSAVQRLGDTAVSRARIGSNHLPWEKKYQVTTNSYHSESGKNVPVARASRPAVAPGPRLAQAEAVVGALVMHNVFGVGAITEVTGSRIRVEFDGVTKDLELAFAPLKLAPNPESLH